MWENRIWTTLQPNNSNDKKRLRLILALVASFFTAAAFWLFTWQRRKCRAEERAATVGGDKTISSQDKGQESAYTTTVSSGAIRQETVSRAVRADEERFDVQRIDKKPARKPKRRHGRRAFAAVAAVLAAVLICQNVLQYMGPASTAMAKESFGGIKQIVKEHGEDNPYVILDIVPGKATYMGYDLSLGTIGYLVNGQAPIQQDLKRILTGDDNSYNSDFYNYAARMGLIDQIMGSNATGAFPGVSYKEGYAGTEQSFNTSDGWMKIYDSWRDTNGQLPTDYSQLPESVSYPTGQLNAKIEYLENADGKSGFDYNWVSGGNFGSATTTMATDGTYIADSEGNYHVIFGNPTDCTSGYRVSAVYADWRNYSDTTAVYRWNSESEIYSYAGTVRGLKEALGENEGSGEDDNGDDSGSDDNGTGSGGDGNNSGNGETLDGDSTENGNLSGGNGNENDNQSDENNGNNEPTVGSSAPLRWYRCVETGSNATLEDGDGSAGSKESSTGSETGSNNTGGNNNDDNNNNDNNNNNNNDDNSNNDNNNNNNNDDNSNNDNNSDDNSNNDNNNDDNSNNDNNNSDNNNNDNNDNNDNDDITDEGDIDDTIGEEGNNDDIIGEGNDGEDGDKKDGSDNGDSDEGEQPVSDENALYVLTFEYVENLEETAFLYKVESADLIEVQESESRPFDSYSLSGLAKGIMDTQQADTALLAEDEIEDGVEGTFIYVGEGQGNYKLTRESGSTKTSNRDSEEITITLDAENHCVKVLNAPVYMRCKSSNDWMKRYVFNSLHRQDNEYSDFTIEVKTVTTGEVTYEMVLEADLIYLEDGSGIYLNSGVDKKYIGKSADSSDDSGNTDDSDSADGSENAGSGALADISDQAIARIIYDAVMELKPVIVDYDIVTTAGFENTNYRKLAKTFLKKDLTAYFDYMSRSDDFVESILINADKESADFPNKMDNGCHYVNRNVYIVSGSELVAEDFAEDLGKNSTKAGFSEVLAAIQAENATLSDDDKLSEKVSKAMAVQYIINFSVGLIGDYRDLSILELQPTANSDSDLHRDASGDRGGIVLYWQVEGQSGAGKQILRSSKEIETNITTKSVVEFNGEYQDINSSYDMIFIGLDGQNLYREYDKNGDLKTVYNDKELNGKVYHRGDKAAAGDERYDANDITEQKKEALLDYMRAGYPIVVENSCFKDRSAKEAKEKDINTDYIGSDTKMYSFLKEAIAEYDEYIYTIEDVHSSAFFASQLNIIKPKVEQLADEDGTDKIATTKTETGDYRGTIKYQVLSDRTGDDKAYPGDIAKHLYLDLNYDGIFAQEEEVFEYLEEPSDGGSAISVDFKEVCFGIVPWKLEVSDTGNGYRRDAIQGYFTLNGDSRATVRVLQVLDDLNIKGANLQLQYEEATNSMLQRYLSGAETLLDMELKIETVTPSVLADRLTRNAQYLSGWDVLVLGFGNSGHPGDTVAAAVNDYIAAGGGVLVSSAGAQADKGRLGITSQHLGQSDGRTYGALGINSGERYRYKDLKSVMFNPLPSLYVESINEGTISSWPYQIDHTVSLGENTEVKAADYLLDIDVDYSEGQTHTTAWYTLNDNYDINTGYNAYSASPRDAANNYYLYSKGNVVYIGQSEYPYISDAPVGTMPEGKGTGESMLFVNALMAAYNNSMHPAELSIVAGFSASATKIESIAVPFDQEIRDTVDSDASILDETVDLYFKFTDNNLAPQKTRTATFYYGDEGVDVTDISQLTQFESQIWTVENNQLIEVTPDMLKPGQIYRIKAPVIALKQNDGAVNAKIYVAIQVDFNRSGQQRSTVGIDSVYLNRAQLFLLE